MHICALYRDCLWLEEFSFFSCLTLLPGPACKIPHQFRHLCRWRRRRSSATRKQTTSRLESLRKLSLSRPHQRQGTEQTRPQPQPRRPSTPPNSRSASRAPSGASVSGTLTTQTTPSSYWTCTAGGVGPQVISFDLNSSFWVVHRDKPFKVLVGTGADPMGYDDNFNPLFVAVPDKVRTG